MSDHDVATLDDGRRVNLGDLKSQLLRSFDAAMRAYIDLRHCGRDEALQLDGRHGDQVVGTVNLCRQLNARLQAYQAFVRELGWTREIAEAVLAGGGTPVEAEDVPSPAGIVGTLASKRDVGGPFFSESRTCKS